MTASLQSMVRDPRTGEVHMPHEPLSIIRTMENLGRTVPWGEAHHAISSALLDTLKNERQEMRKPEALETVDSIVRSDLRKEELIDMLISILGAQKARHDLLRRRESWIV